MTIERLKVGLRAAGMAAAVLGAWFALLAATTALIAPGQVLVLGSGAIEKVVRADGRLMATGWAAAQAQSDESGFVGRLYANGAWLVLPAAGGGCRGRARG
jgi:hypothetical protein